MIPAVLVSAVAAGCGEGKPPTTTDATEPATGGQTTTSPGTTTATTAPTTGAGTTTTGTTGVVTTGSTDTGGIPDCQMLASEVECNTETACFWYADIGQCVTDCAMITDEATCAMQNFCSWIDEHCELILV